MASTGIVQLIKMEEEIEVMANLGYPAYMLTLLGVWKILGVIAVLIPKFPLVKEWAYAGFFFVMSGAICSHLVNGDGAITLFGPSMLLLLTVISWYFRPADRKLVLISKQKNEKMSRPEDVDSYIANATQDTREIMHELRELIKSTVPEADEGIGWNVPIYRYHGILAGFDVARNHVSFGIDSLQDEDRELLGEEGYKTGKRTIRIKFDQEVPAKMVKKLLLRQAEINETK